MTQNRHISWQNDILYEFENFFLQKYALLIFWRSIMGFLRPKYFFSESLILALFSEV